jgi:hypothetical protein
MARVTYNHRQMEDLIEIAGSLIYGGAALRKRATKLLEAYRAKSAEEVRRELGKIKSRLSEDIVKARYAE